MAETTQQAPRFSDLLESRARAVVSEEVSIGEMLELLGDRSMLGMLLLLALPMALPVPTPGLSFPFGACMVIVAVQLIVGRRHAWLPTFLTRRSLSRETFIKLMERMVLALRRLEYLVKPREKWLAPHWLIVPVSLVCLVLALLVALPIPFSNAVPGVAIVILSLGMLERDGITVWVGLLVSLMSFALIILASNGLYDVLLHGWHARW